MSFTYGGTDTETLAGVTATLQQWPSHGGLTVQHESAGSSGGRIFAGSGHERTAFVFDVIIYGRTVAELSQRRDTFGALVDPSRGPRDLLLETDPDWKWADVLLAEEIVWERFTWRTDLGFRLRATVTFETQRSAVAVETTPTKLSGTGTVKFTANRGNTACFPRVVIPSGGDFVITINDFELPLRNTPTGLTAVLDWDVFRFDLTNSAGIRVRSLVPFMSHYQRPTIMPGEAVTMSASKSVSVTVYPNYRRN